MNACPVCGARMTTPWCDACGHPYPDESGPVEPQSTTSDGVWAGGVPSRRPFFPLDTVAAAGHACQP